MTTRSADDGDPLARIGIGHLPIPVLVVAVDGIIQSVNAELLRQLGYSPGELNGKPADTVLPEGPSFTPGSPENEATVTRERKVAGRTALRKDGSLLPVSVSVTWLSNASGRIALATVVDASEREPAVLEVQQALGRAIQFERLLNELTASFVHLTPEQLDGAIERALHLLLDALDVDRCTIFQCDDAAQEFVLTHAAARPGLPAPVIGKLNGEDFPWTVAKIRRREAAGFSSPDQIPDPIEHATVVRVGTRARMAVPLLTRGRVAGAISFGVIRDGRSWSPETLNRMGLIAHVLGGALARRDSDIALQSSERRFRTLADNAPAMIWTSRPDNSCSWFNRRWLEFVGKPLENEIGRGWVNEVHPDDLDQCLRIYEDSSQQRVPFTVEYRLRRHDGEWRWVLDSGTPNISADGTFEGYVGCCVEVTEQKQAVQRAEQVRDDLHAENVYLRGEVKNLLGAGPLVGRSAAIQRVLAIVEQVAPTDTTVLLLGETGTGKEVLASRIHELSARRTRAMVRVNCAAIPATLIESELFGRERGAFTGALTRQAGRFELADRSTIFLDEIGDLPLDIQVKLLRVLEERQFERLGSSAPVRSDTRIIAATHRNLEQRTAQGTFREDLFYRLNVFPIVVPPLRERVDDIPVLVWHFIDEFSATFNRRFDSIPASNMAALQEYPWPGNIRELRNVVERAMIVATGPHLTIPLPESPTAAPVSASTRLVDVEREHIRRVLESTGWRIRGNGGAADRLGLAPTTLESRMAKLGLSRKSG